MKRTTNCAPTMASIALAVVLAMPLAASCSDTGGGAAPPHVLEPSSTTTEMAEKKEDEGRYDDGAYDYKAKAEEKSEDAPPPPATPEAAAVAAPRAKANRRRVSNKRVSDKPSPEPEIVSELKPMEEGGEAVGGLVLGGKAGSGSASVSGADSAGGQGYWKHGAKDEAKRIGDLRNSAAAGPKGTSTLSNREMGRTEGDSAQLADETTARAPKKPAPRRGHGWSDDTDGKARGKLGLNDFEETEEATGEEADNDARDRWDEGKRKELSKKVANRGLLGLLAVSEQSKQQVAQDLMQEGERAPEPKPESFLPRMFYFENTYLGGNAAAEERVRRLDAALGSDAHRLASSYGQPLDPPPDAGLRVEATLDKRWIERPGRVYLQVTLVGSERYGWRRPPLDVMLVVDASVARQPGVVMSMLESMVRKLGPQDRLGVLFVGMDEVVAPPERLRTLKLGLGERIDEVGRPAGGSSAGELRRAMLKAGHLLREAAQDVATIPGTQTIVLLTDDESQARVDAAAGAAHEMTVQGVVTSVVELDGGSERPWWKVANAGHGNYHRVGAGQVAQAVDAELESLAKVVARLIRVNVRLAGDVKAIRVLGSRKLDEEEVRQVKAREVATDQNLSKTMGVSADRGDDDDGIQTVIPYFYGGDSHVIVLELWVEKPGDVADVTVRYKDMVNLGNATARTAVDIAATPRNATPQQRMVDKNVRGMRIAEALKTAASRVQRGQVDDALQALAEARQLVPGDAPEDARMLASFQQLVQRNRYGNNLGTVAEALQLAGERKVGQPPR